MKLRKAINDHCKSCSYDSKSGLGTWRKQVQDCSCTLCYLYPVRPRTLPKRRDSQAVSDVAPIEEAAHGQQL